MGVADNKSYKDTYHFKDNFPITREEMPSINVDPKINSTIKKNPYRSNVEVEKDEIIFKPDFSALFNVKGKTHKGGGVDVLLENNSFVFSDDKSLAFTELNHKMMELKKGGSFKAAVNTPADVLKRNIDPKHYNKLIANIEDPKKDDIAKNSSMKMLEKYMQTLGNIAFIQEQKKGFPDGLPTFAENTAPVYDDDLKEEVMEQKQYAKYGGNIKAQKGKLLTMPQMDSARRAANYWHGKSKNPNDYWANWDGVSDEVFNEFQRLTPYQNYSLDPTANIKSDPYPDINQPFEFNQKWYIRKNKELVEVKKPTKTSMSESKFNPANPYLNRNTAPSVESIPVVAVPPAATQAATTSGNAAPGVSGVAQLPKVSGVLPLAEKITYTPKTPDKITPLNRPIVPDINVNGDGVKRADWQFTPWQKENQAYNLWKWASAKRYMPYRSHLNPSYVDPALVNPEQTIGDMKGAFNANLQGINSLSPILRNAQAADSYGQVLNQMPQVRSQYDNQNAGITNQFRQYNNQIANQARQTNMVNDQNYYKETVVGQQNFDNLRSYLGDKYMTDRSTDVADNQSLAYNLLTQNNPAWNYDWRTGNFTRTNKSIMDAQGTAGNEMYDKILAGLDKLPDSDPKKWEIYEKIMRQKNILPYLTKSAKKGGTIKHNPYK